MADQIKYDLDGYDTTTAALLDLLNQYPGLENGYEISLATLDEDSGIAMYPISGAVIETEKRFVTGRTLQVCLYPFYIIYRASGPSESRRAAIKEWLDSLGRWLEGRTITVKDVEHQLGEYPSLTGNRKFLSIVRQSPAYLDTVNENKSENWAVYITARYQNTF